jgi:hypothetical protein
VQILVAKTPLDVESIHCDWDLLRARHGKVPCIQNDPGHYLIHLRERPGDFVPHVVLFRRNDCPLAIIVAKEFDQQIRCRVGAGRVPLVTLRSLAIVYGGIITDCSEEAQTAVLQYLKQIVTRRQVQSVTINHLRNSHEMFESIEKLRPDFQMAEKHWFCRLGTTYEQTTINLSSKSRRARSRMDRRMSEHFAGNVELRDWRKPEEVIELCQRCAQIASQGYLGRLGAGFSDTPLWHEFLTSDARLGRLRSYTLECGGAAAAFLIGVVYGDVYVPLFTGYLPEFREWSPGQMMLVRVLRDLCGAGVRVVDYGWGNQDYKIWFGNAVSEDVSMHFYARGIKPQFVKHMVRVTEGFSAAAKRGADRLGIATWIRRRWRKRLERLAQSRRGVTRPDSGKE